MSDSSYKTLLKSKQQASPFEELVEGVSDALENDYQPYKVGLNGKAESMIEINMKGSKSLLIYYFDIKKIIFEGEGLISIIHPLEIITIEGDNLQLLRKYFRDNRVQIINEFDPAKYDQVTKGDAPFIHEITITDRQNAE